LKSMKRIFPFLLLPLIFSACKTEKNKENVKLISVSILPQKYFTEQIAGQAYKINVLIPPGASPATYEPSPRQMQELSDSDVYLKIGAIAFEKAWIEKYQGQNSSVQFYDLSEGVGLIQSEKIDHNHHTHDHQSNHRHEGPDPHIWMSPENALIISENIYHALSEIYPHDSIKFREGWERLKNTLLEIESLFESKSSQLKGKDFLIYHPALTYLADDYGMNQHVLEFEGKEPPPSYIAKIIHTARKKNINFIFVQKQFSLDNARSLAGEINAEIIPIDPLSEDWPGEMKRILKLLTNESTTENE
ncbi:MAG: metal ABC transporter solute-binding protein, Zn/Mn family, partial [Bacteroidota bacterium]